MDIHYSLEEIQVNNENAELQDGLFLCEKTFENIRAESPEELIDNNRTLFSIMESIPNGIAILSTSLKVIYTNQKMRTWFAHNRRNYKIKCYRLFHNGQKKPCEKYPVSVCKETKASASVIHNCGLDENTGEPLFMHIHVFPILNSREEINLSARELQVAMMIKDGRTSKEIASELCITKKAVDYHRSSIRKKLKIDSKANLQSYIKAYL